MKSRARFRGPAAAVAAVAVVIAAVGTTRVSAGPVALPAPFPEGEGPDGTKYKTAYRCEGETLKIACDPDALIHVIRANYGRFSIAICNKHGYTDWSVNCMAPRTTKVLQERCDSRRSCQLEVTSRLFGDPCPGTHKYVEVHYACSKVDPTTTRRPMPKWFLEGGAVDLWAPNNPNKGVMRRPDSSPTSDPEPSDLSSPVVSTQASSTSTSALTSSSASSTSTSSIYFYPTLMTSSKAGGGGAGSPGLAHNTQKPSRPPPRKPILVTQPTTPVRIPITTPRPRTTTAIGSTTGASDEEKKLNEITVLPPEYDHISTIAPEPSAPSTVSHPTVAVMAPSLPPPSQELPDIEVIVSDVHQPSTTSTASGAESNPFLEKTHCKPTYARGIYWNWTKRGEVAIVPCPLQATGLARWGCLESGGWSGAYPDLGDCKSNRMTSLESQVRQEDPEDVLVSTLAQMTRPQARQGPSGFYGGDLEAAVSIMRTLANRLQYLLQSRADSFYKKERYIGDVFQNLLRAASHLLSPGQRAAWLDLQVSRQMKVATGLLLALEANAFLLAEVNNEEEYLEEAASEILMALNVQYPSDRHNTSLVFPPAQDSPLAQSQTLYGQSMDYIELPVESLKHIIDHHGLNKAIFFAYKGLHEILDSAENSFVLPNTDDGSPEEETARYHVNSRVLSASLTKGRHLELNEPVSLTLSHLSTSLVEPVCAFWNYELNLWSDAGCTVVETNETMTRCQCTHLTHFALLMKEPQTQAGWLHTLFVLQIVAYVVLAIIVVLAAVFLIKFRANLSKLWSKVICFVPSEKKNLDKGGCPKSQSFYTGVHLVPVAGAAGSAVDSSSSPQMGSEVTIATSTSGGQEVKTHTMSTNSVNDNNARLSQYLISATPNGQLLHHQLEPAHQAQLATSATLRLPPQHYSLSPALGHTSTMQLPSSFLNVYGVDAMDGMEATRHLRDSVYMSPQLVHLTNTLRSKKKCQAGHMSSSAQSTPLPQARSQVIPGSQASHSYLPENEVVFRAVSPHGHVYWEIDPKRDVAPSSSALSDEEERQCQNSQTSSSDMSSRQSSSRYSDHHPLINSDSPHVLVNPFADVQLLPATPSATPTRFSSLRPHAAGSPRASPFQESESAIPEQVQRQVQIRDLRAIPGHVKSNDYILAKIQSHLTRGSPVELVAATSGRTKSPKPKQRKV